ALDTPVGVQRTPAGLAHHVRVHVRVHADRQQRVQGAVQGDQRFADAPGQGNPAHGPLRLRPAGIVVVGVARGRAAAAERHTGVQRTVVRRVEGFTVDTLGQVPVDPVVVVPQELRAGG